jgi:hypothetical protein
MPCDAVCIVSVPRCTSSCLLSAGVVSTFSSCEFILSQVAYSHYGQQKLDSILNFGGPCI